MTPPPRRYRPAGGSAPARPAGPVYVPVPHYSASAAVPPLGYNDGVDSYRSPRSPNPYLSRRTQSYSPEGSASAPYYQAPHQRQALLDTPYDSADWGHDPSISASLRRPDRT